MAKEIEFKFLIDPNFDFISLCTEKKSITQGYISRTPTTRIRIINDEKAVITIKSPADKTGSIRHEFEYEIPITDAKQMLILFATNDLIIKDRYIYKFDGGRWEFDIFYGKNEGLVVAEMELDKIEHHTSVLPSWVIKDVTADPRYLNCNLMTNPYCNWKDTI